MKSNKYSVILGNLGNTCDRFLSSGYKDEQTKEEMVHLAGSIEGLKGLELVGSWDVTIENHKVIKSLLEANGLQCVSIIPDHFSRKIWGKGSFCSRDQRVRQEAIDETVRAAEIAGELDCDLLNLWLGQDGYDYPLQGDFGRQRGWILEGITSVAEKFPDMNFALEYKMKEPRTHSFHARAADTLLMAQETGLKNVGVCIDVGHSLLAQENVAESVWLLQHYGNKLFHMHFNDNYRYWDDDMIVGSIHFTEYVELCYWLKKTGYDGWYSMDLYPYREDGVAAVSESIEFLRQLERCLTEQRLAEIEKLIAEGEATESTKWIRNLIFYE